MTKRVLIEDATDRETELALHRLVLEQVATQTGHRISFTVKELARCCDISPRDVLDKTADIVMWWWIDGRRFATYRDLFDHLERHFWEPVEDVELELYRDECGSRLVAALLGMEPESRGGAA